MSSDFVLNKEKRIEELQCTLRELTHLPTGAQVMQIENDDPENLFCLSFKTLPFSSNGAAHILEHTVLCGSKKFPVKDPFFAMNRRSLNTFMNALTGSDFTCYPAATQVEKDFYNLLDVYLDAVFHPELKKLSFLQEGHRLEFAEDGSLEFKGIVFNEMKGGMNSPDVRIWHQMMESLCPDLPYAYNSGGDPKVIPTLTYEELLDFHKTYYHPSHCLFFFYGNLPLKQHLDFITEKALKNVTEAPPLPPLKTQKRFQQPKHVEMRYPLGEKEEKVIVTFGFLTTQLLNQQELLALTLLDSILMDTDASLLKSALLKSGLCVQADAMMDTEMSEVPYGIVCKGVKKENVDKLEKCLKDSLRTIIQNKIPSSKITASLHQLEFSRSEITGDTAPFGLTLFMRSALAKQHGCKPENALMIHSLFADLLKRIQEGDYLEGLIEKYLLNNPHLVRLVAVPDSHLIVEEADEEKKRLEEIKEHLNEKEKEQILKQTEELAEYQKKIEHQSLNCLPKVDLSDVPIETRDFPLTQEKVGNLLVFHHASFTNHILYVDLVFDLPDVAEEDLPFVQLFVSMLAEVGAGRRNFAENLEMIHAYTGGIGASLALNVQASNPNQMKPSLHIRGKALERNAEKLLSLLYDTATSVRLDEKERIQELLLQYDNALQNRLTRNALKYAVQLALSGFSIPAYIADHWQGLKYLKKIHEYSISPPFEKLAFFKEKLLCLKNPHLVISCDQALYDKLSKEHFLGLSHLPSKSFTPMQANYSLPSIISQIRPIASPVAFTCEAFQTISYLHPDAPALSAATQLFDNKILHKRVREIGGAYGVGSHYNSSLGNFYFHSYRDPHFQQTLNAFHAAIDAIAKGHFDGRDLEEAKLGIIQQFDMPTAPGNRAALSYTRWREGKTKQMRQKYRDQLLSLSSEKISHSVEKELLSKKQSGIIVSFMGEELALKEKGSLSIIPL